MNTDSLSIKMIGIGVVAFMCLVASLFVLSVIDERKTRHDEVKQEIGATWGAPQTIVGPFLVFKDPTLNDTYILPSTLSVVSTLHPEIRARGMFETVVYNETLTVSGTFSKNDIPLNLREKDAFFSVSLTDTRSIETEVALTWNATSIAFKPGSDAPLLTTSGIHTQVPLRLQGDTYTFSFTLALKGSNERLVAPVGKETKVVMDGAWNAPSFIGAFLPSTRSVADTSFSAEWNVSSFGRNYPQIFLDDQSVTLQNLADSAFGVRLDDGVDLYTLVERSTKYAILFIVVTFAVFFLFEVRAHTRLHVLNYLLVGGALALFYLLLLSFAEHIGFLYAYLLATLIITALVTLYSKAILGSIQKALSVALQLMGLYSYLYVVLNLEDYALLCGSLLLLFLLASIMYLTRSITWTKSVS